jgi:hypothetical protein
VDLDIDEATAPEFRFSTIPGAPGLLPDGGNDAGSSQGQAPRNKGMRYPTELPTVEEIVLLMRPAGDRAHGLRLPEAE